MKPPDMLRKYSNEFRARAVALLRSRQMMMKEAEGLGLLIPAFVAG